MSTTHYGIPGHMISVGTNCKLEPHRPFMPSILKQTVTRDEENHTMTIQHQVLNSANALHLPFFAHSHCTNYLFYCHSPETKNQVYAENYHHFLNHAWPETRDDESFFVCILHNAETNFGYSWLAPNTIVIRRPNEGLDFGAYTDGLHFTNLDMLQKEHAPFHAFFMNDTVYGPVYPWWFPSNCKWTTILKNMIVKDVKLAGMTINPDLRRQSHVQSMLLVTDHIGLTIAMNAKVFARRITKYAVVHESETAFSSAILGAGFNIDCLAELLHGIDYRVPSEIPIKGFHNVISSGGYGGHSIHPFETIFSKTNRMNRDLCLKMKVAKQKRLLHQRLT